MSEKKTLREKYVESLAALPPWKCGRLDMNTYLPEPVQVGRVRSDVVRYVYFEDGEEVIVVGQRADEIAFAAAEYPSIKRLEGVIDICHEQKERMAERNSDLQAQLALVTAERDKAIERSAILGLAVDHYADIRNWYCPQCNVGGESPDCPLVSLRCSNNHQGFDIAVKAKQDAAAPTGAGKEEE